VTIWNPCNTPVNWDIEEISQEETDDLVAFFKKQIEEGRVEKFTLDAEAFDKFVKELE
jgi:hypothetical protein